METKFSKKMVIVSILLLTTMSACAQQATKEEFTVVPIDSIYLENRGNQLALNSITTKNIQSLLGEPISIKIYKEEWSDEYDKQTTYEYKLLTIRFQSLENKEWLHRIECLNPDISVIINGIRLFAGMKDSVLNIFEKSWEIYQELENTKYYQDNVKRGDTEKTFIIKFPIKKGNYEYLGLIYIGTKNGTIIRVRLFLQDEA